MELSRYSIKEAAKGQLYRVPGYATLINASRRFRPQLSSARYCYSVWLRHLVAAHENGLELKPRVVLELGPGDSIGAGLAALLSGAERYVVVDWVRYTNMADNLDVLEELRTLFRNRSPIPDDDEFPSVRPKLQCYAFPTDLIPEPPAESKIERIRRALAQRDSEDSCIRYFAPYNHNDVVIAGGADIVFSQAVMEHVDDPESLYEASYDWLRPGGFASHVIDYRSHATSSRWNGHWAYSDAAWRLIRGKKPYLLNRMPHSVHRQLLTRYQFDIVAEVLIKAASEIHRAELAPAFRSMSDDDLSTAGALLQAIKR